MCRISFSIMCKHKYFVMSLSKAAKRSIKLAFLNFLPGRTKFYSILPSPGKRKRPSFLDLSGQSFVIYTVLGSVELLCLLKNKQPPRGILPLEQSSVQVPKMGIIAETSFIELSFFIAPGGLSSFSLTFKVQVPRENARGGDEQDLGLSEGIHGASTQGLGSDHSLVAGVGAASGHHPANSDKRESKRLCILQSNIHNTLDCFSEPNL